MANVFDRLVSKKSLNSNSGVFSEVAKHSQNGENLEGFAHVTLPIEASHKETDPPSTRRPHVAFQNGATPIEPDISSRPTPTQIFGKNKPKAAIYLEGVPNILTEEANMKKSKFKVKKTAPAERPKISNLKSPSTDESDVEVVSVKKTVVNLKKPETLKKRQPYAPLKKPFVIPRKQKNDKQLLQEVKLDSREYLKEIHPILLQNYRDQMSKNKFSYEAAYLINNEQLLTEFLDKKKEMKEEGRNEKEVADSYGFYYCPVLGTAKEIASKGLIVRTSLVKCLGNPSMGVYLSRHSDILRPALFVPNSQEHFMMIFRVMKGKVKSIQESFSSNNVLEPTPNYDCHISKNAKQQTNFDLNQIYFYEYGEEDTIPRPRQVCPYAVIKFTIKEVNKVAKKAITTPTVSVPVTPKTVPSDNGNVKCQSLAKPSPVVDGTTVKTVSDDVVKDGYTIWTGKLTNRKQPLFTIELFSKNSPITPFKLPSYLDLTMKVPIARLKSQLTERIFSIATRPRNLQEVYVNGRFYISCMCKTLAEDKPKIDSLVAYLHKQKIASVVKLPENCELFFYTSEKESGILYCLFSSKSKMVSHLRDCAIKNKMSDPVPYARKLPYCHSCLFTTFKDQCKYLDEMRAKTENIKKLVNLANTSTESKIGHGKQKPAQAKKAVVNMRDPRVSQTGLASVKSSSDMQLNRVVSSERLPDVSPQLSPVQFSPSVSPKVQDGSLPPPVDTSDYGTFGSGWGPQKEQTPVGKISETIQSQLRELQEQLDALRRAREELDNRDRSQMNIISKQQPSHLLKKKVPSTHVMKHKTTSFSDEYCSLSTNSILPPPGNQDEFLTSPTENNPPVNGNEFLMETAKIETCIHGDVFLPAPTINNLSTYDNKFLSSSSTPKLASTEVDFLTTLEKSSSISKTTNPSVNDDNFPTTPTVAKPPVQDEEFLSPASPEPTLENIGFLAINASNTCKLDKSVLDKVKLSDNVFTKLKEITDIKEITRVADKISMSSQTSQSFCGHTTGNNVSTSNVPSSTSNDSLAAYSEASRQMLSNSSIKYDVANFKEPNVNCSDYSSQEMDYDYLPHSEISAPHAEHNLKYDWTNNFDDYSTLSMDYEYISDLEISKTHVEANLQNDWTNSIENYSSLPMDYEYLQGSEISTGNQSGTVAGDIVKASKINPSENTVSGSLPQETISKELSKVNDQPVSGSNALLQQPKCTSEETTKLINTSEVIDNSKGIDNSKLNMEENCVSLPNLIVSYPLSKLDEGENAGVTHSNVRIPEKKQSQNNEENSIKNVCNSEKIDIKSVDGTTLNLKDKISAKKRCKYYNKEHSSKKIKIVQESEKKTEIGINSILSNKDDLPIKIPKHNVISKVISGSKRKRHSSENDAQKHFLNLKSKEAVKSIVSQYKKGSSVCGEAGIQLDKVFSEGKLVTSTDSKQTISEASHMKHYLDTALNLSEVNKMKEFLNSYATGSGSCKRKSTHKSLLLLNGGKSTSSKISAKKVLQRSSSLESFQNTKRRHASEPHRKYSKTIDSEIMDKFEILQTKKEISDKEIVGQERKPDVSCASNDTSIKCQNLKRSLLLSKEIPKQSSEKTSKLEYTTKLDSSEKFSNLESDLIKHNLEKCTTNINKMQSKKVTKEVVREMSNLESKEIVTSTKVKYLESDLVKCGNLKKDATNQDNKMLRKTSTQQVQNMSPFECRTKLDTVVKLTSDLSMNKNKQPVNKKQVKDSDQSVINTYKLENRTIPECNISQNNQEKTKVEQRGYLGEHYGPNLLVRKSEKLTDTGSEAESGDDRKVLDYYNKSHNIKKPRNRLDSSYDGSSSSDGEGRKSLIKKLHQPRSNMTVKCKGNNIIIQIRCGKDRVDWWQGVTSKEEELTKCVLHSIHKDKSKNITGGDMSPTLIAGILATVHRKKSRSPNKGKANKKIVEVFSSGETPECRQSTSDIEGDKLLFEDDKIGNKKTFETGTFREKCKQLYKLYNYEVPAVPFVTENKSNVSEMNTEIEGTNTKENGLQGETNGCTEKEISNNVDMKSFVNTFHEFESVAGTDMLNSSKQLDNKESMKRKMDMVKHENNDKSHSSYSLKSKSIKLNLTKSSSIFRSTEKPTMSDMSSRRVEVIPEGTPIPVIGSSICASLKSEGKQITSRISHRSNTSTRSKEPTSKHCNLKLVSKMTKVPEYSIHPPEDDIFEDESHHYLISSEETSDESRKCKLEPKISVCLDKQRSHQARIVQKVSTSIPSLTSGISIQEHLQDHSNKENNRSHLGCGIQDENESEEPSYDYLTSATRLHAANLFSKNQFTIEIQKIQIMINTMPENLNSWENPAGIHTMERCVVLPKCDIDTPGQIEVKENSQVNNAEDKRDNNNNYHQKSGIKEKTHLTTSNCSNIDGNVKHENIDDVNEKDQTIRSVSISKRGKQDKRESNLHDDNSCGNSHNNDNWSNDVRRYNRKKASSLNDYSKGNSGKNVHISTIRISISKGENNEQVRKVMVREKTKEQDRTNINLTSRTFRDRNIDSSRRSVVKEVEKSRSDRVRNLHSRYKFNNSKKDNVNRQKNPKEKTKKDGRITVKNQRKLIKDDLCPRKCNNKYNFTKACSRHKNLKKMKSSKKEVKNNNETAVDKRFMKIKDPEVKSNSKNDFDASVMTDVEVDVGIKLNAIRKQTSLRSTVKNVSDNVKVSVTKEKGVPRSRMKENDTCKHKGNLKRKDLTSRALKIHRTNRTDRARLVRDKYRKSTFTQRDRKFSKSHKFKKICSNKAEIQGCEDNMDSSNENQCIPVEEAVETLHNDKLHTGDPHSDHQCIPMCSNRQQMKDDFGQPSPEYRNQQQGPRNQQCMPKQDNHQMRHPIGQQCVAVHGNQQQMTDPRNQQCFPIHRNQQQMGDPRSQQCIPVHVNQQEMGNPRSQHCIPLYGNQQQMGNPRSQQCISVYGNQQQMVGDPRNQQRVPVHGNQQQMGSPRSHQCMPVHGNQQQMGNLRSQQCVPVHGNQQQMVNPRSQQCMPMHGNQQQMGNLRSQQCVPVHGNQQQMVNPRSQQCMPTYGNQQQMVGPRRQQCMSMHGNQQVGNSRSQQCIQVYGNQQQMVDPRIQQGVQLYGNQQQMGQSDRSHQFGLIHGNQYMDGRNQQCLPIVNHLRATETACQQFVMNLNQDIGIHGNRRHDVICSNQQLNMNSQRCVISNQHQGELVNSNQCAPIQIPQRMDMQSNIQRLIQQNIGLQNNNQSIHGNQYVIALHSNIQQSNGIMNQNSTQFNQHNLLAANQFRDLNQFNPNNRVQRSMPTHGNSQHNVQLNQNIIQSNQHHIIHSNQQVVQHLGMLHNNQHFAMNMARYRF